MITNFKIAIRYSVLIGLLMMLWLCIEFMIGLQDKYADLLLYSAILSLCIPIFGIWRALKEKREVVDGSFSFQQAFATAILVVLFSSVLAMVVQFVFTNFVNPDYFQGLIEHYVHKAFAAGGDTGKARTMAEQYFNLQFSIIEAFLWTFLSGILAAAFWAWRLSSGTNDTATS